MHSFSNCSVIGILEGGRNGTEVSQTLKDTF